MEAVASVASAWALTAADSLTVAPAASTGVSVAGSAAFVDVVVGSAASPRVELSDSVNLATKSAFLPSVLSPLSFNTSFN